MSDQGDAARICRYAAWLEVTDPCWNQSDKLRSTPQSLFAALSKAINLRSALENPDCCIHSIPLLEI